MPAISLDAAQNIAAVAAIVLTALALVGAWLIKNTVQKAVLAVALIVVAVVVWQRGAALGDCADDVREAGLQSDTTCSFFGFDVDIPTVGS